MEEGHDGKYYIMIENRAEKSGICGFSASLKITLDIDL
jgi:hypothetical protein